MKAEWKAKRGKHICMSCGNCIVACPNNAIRFNKSKNKIIINNSKCSGCGECVKVCPEVGSMIRLKEENGM